MKKHLFSITKKDFTIQTFKSGGPGGQHQNKTDSGVRIIHKDSGAVAECRSSRSQHQNKRTALTRLVDTPKFKLWLAKVTFEITSGETIEERVEKQMNPNNIKVEYKEGGKWTNSL